MAHSEHNATQSPTYDVMEVKQNSKYYIDYDPMAVFLVENQLFRVHRHFLTQGSAFFRNIFNSLTEVGAPEASNVDSLPIPLQEVTAGEFESLLDYFYQLPHPRPTELPLQVCLDLLNVSRHFLFDDIMQFSLQGLEVFTAHVKPLDRLLLGDKYRLEGWASSAYAGILNRNDSLTEKEAEALGYERLVGFIADRDKRFKQELAAATELLRLEDTQSTGEGGLASSSSTLVRKKKKGR